MSHTSSKTFFTPKNIKIVLNIFQYFYLASSIMILFAFIITAVNGKTLVVLLPSSIVAAIIAYGIYNKTSWSPFVITLLAAFSIVSNLFRLPGEPLISLLFIVVLTFEIYFFNRKDIKQLFKVKNTATLF